MLTMRKSSELVCCSEIQNSEWLVDVNSVMLQIFERKVVNRGFKATLSYLAFMKFFRRVKKHVSVLAFILFFTIL